MQVVLVIDDDEVSRELLQMFVEEAGYEAHAASSGDDAVALVKQTGMKPLAVLADMQMNGTTGNALAKALREVCGGETRMIAMSGSGAKAAAAGEFDSFLLKPMTPEQVRTAVEGGTPQDAATGLAGEEMLSEATYRSLAQGMPAEQLLKLYKMCLDDAERRIGTMRDALAANDAGAYERAAHAIKGGCGMVGALELAALAERMEEQGPKTGGELGPLDEFLDALKRLRRMLDARTMQVTNVSNGTL